MPAGDEPRPVACSWQDVRRAVRGDVDDTGDLVLERWRARFRERLRAAERFEQEFTAGSDPVPRATRSLAREALLLSIHPRTGKPWNGARYVVPAALLLELVHEGRLEVSGEGKKARATVRDATPLGDPELDEALRRIGTSVLGNKLTRLVGLVPQTLGLLDRLLEEGVVREEEDRWLGLFPVRRYRPQPGSGHDTVADRARRALLGESVPDQRTAMLVSALVGVHPKVLVPRGKVNEAYRRLPEIRARLPRDEQSVVAAARAVLQRAND